MCPFCDILHEAKPKTQTNSREHAIIDLEVMHEPSETILFDIFFENQSIDNVFSGGERFVLPAPHQ